METTRVLIPDLTKCYDIGKKPLARLLGWGETTVLRYLNGQAEPNAEFLRRIEELHENPWEYLKLLEYNKEKNVLTDVAYRKTKAAVINKILCDRATEAMQYVISLAEGDIAPSLVIAVLYYAQMCYWAFHKEPLFEEEISVKEQASVYPRLYEKMMQQGLHALPMIYFSLEEEEKEYIKMVHERLRMYAPVTIQKALLREKKWMGQKGKRTGIAWTPEELKQRYEIRLDVKKHTELKQEQIDKLIRPGNDRKGIKKQ